MTDEEKNDDRRNNKRFKVDEGAFAALSPDSSIMGQLDNISKGGLCFKYIVHEDQSAEMEATHVFVGINGFYLEKMPYKVVEDIQVENNSTLSSINMRRRRLQFVDLSLNQAAQLDYFLKNRTGDSEE